MDGEHSVQEILQRCTELMAAAQNPAGVMLTVDQWCEPLDWLYSRLNPYPRPESIESVAEARRFYGLELNQVLDYKAIEDRHREAQAIFPVLQILFDRLGLGLEGEGGSEEDQARTQKINLCSTLENSYFLILLYAQVSDDILNQRDFSRIPDDFKVHNLARPTKDDTSLHHLLHHFYDQAQKRGLRRHRGHLYSQVFVPGTNVATGAWQFEIELKHFVYGCLSRYQNAAMFKHAMSQGGIINKAIDYIESAFDDQLPDVNPCRFVYAFRNGHYNIEEERFTAYDAPDFQRTSASKFFDMDFDDSVPPYHEGEPRGSLWSFRRSQEAVINDKFTAEDRALFDMYYDRYVPADFNGNMELPMGVPCPEEDWQALQALFFRYGFRPSYLYRDPMLIPTPDFSSILQTQDLSDRVQEWIFIFIGRILYPIRMHDDWQVALFLKGIANTGKSAIIATVQNLFNKDDIAALSSNIEQQFGLSAIWGKLAWFCVEMTHSFRLPQGDFQSMITGESVVVATKNQTAKTVDWNIPGMIVGNVNPPFIDAAGSMTRRLPVVEFNKYVTNVDAGLKSRIFSGEMANILRKANMMYRMAASNYPDVWAALPPYFKQTKARFQSQVNPVIDFVGNGDVVKVSQGHWILLSEFKLLFAKYCKDMGRATTQLTNEQIISMSNVFGLSHEKAAVHNVGSARLPQTGDFLIGVCRKDEWDHQVREMQLLNGEADQQEQARLAEAGARPGVSGPARHPTASARPAAPGYLQAGAARISHSFISASSATARPTSAANASVAAGTGGGVIPQVVTPQVVTGNGAGSYGDDVDPHAAARAFARLQWQHQHPAPMMTDQGRHFGGDDDDDDDDGDERLERPERPERLSFGARQPRPGDHSPHSDEAYELGERYADDEPDDVEFGIGDLPPTGGEDLLQDHLAASLAQPMTVDVQSSSLLPEPDSDAGGAPTTGKVPGGKVLRVPKLRTGDTGQPPSSH